MWIFPDMILLQRDIFIFKYSMHTAEVTAPSKSSMNSISSCINKYFYKSFDTRSGQNMTEMRATAYSKLIRVTC